MQSTEVICLNCGTTTRYPVIEQVDKRTGKITRVSLQDCMPKCCLSGEIEDVIVFKPKRVHKIKPKGKKVK